MLAAPAAARDAALISQQRIYDATQCEEAQVYELSLHNQKLRSMLGLSRCTRLRLLDLSFNAICAIEGLETLGDLRELRLYANVLTHVGGLEGTPKLQTLLLHANQLGTACVVGAGLGRLTQLATLRLDGNPKLSSDGLKQLRLLELPSLTDLNASSVNLASADGLRGLRALTSLELEHNQLHSLGAIAQLTSLQELMLSSNHLEGAALAALKQLTSLTLLRLNDNALASLDQLPPLPRLVELHLAGNQLTSLPPLTYRHAAAAAPANPREKPEKPQERRLLPRLEVLDLSDNSIGSVEALAPLTRRALPALSELRLRRNGVCAARADALVRALSAAVGGALLLDESELSELARRVEGALAHMASDGDVDAKAAALRAQIATLRHRLAHSLTRGAARAAAAADTLEAEAEYADDDEAHASLSLSLSLAADAPCDRLLLDAPADAPPSLEMELARHHARLHKQMQPLPPAAAAARGGAHRGRLDEARSFSLKACAAPCAAPRRSLAEVVIPPSAAADEPPPSPSSPPHDGGAIRFVDDGAEREGGASAAEPPLVVTAARAQRGPPSRDERSGYSSFRTPRPAGPPATPAGEGNRPPSAGVRPGTPGKLAPSLALRALSSNKQLLSQIPSLADACTSLPRRGSPTEIQ